VTELLMIAVVWTVFEPGLCEPGTAIITDIVKVPAVL
jgi:hypothetical protein